MIVVECDGIIANVRRARHLFTGDDERLVLFDIGVRAMLIRDIVQFQRYKDIPSGSAQDQVNGQG